MTLIRYHFDVTPVCTWRAVRPQALVQERQLQRSSCDAAQSSRTCTKPSRSLVENKIGGDYPKMLASSIKTQSVCRGSSWKVSGGSAGEQCQECLLGCPSQCLRTCMRGARGFRRRSIGFP